MQDPTDLLQPLQATLQLLRSSRLRAAFPQILLVETGAEPSLRRLALHSCDSFFSSSSRRLYMLKSMKQFLDTWIMTIWTAFRATD